MDASVLSVVPARAGSKGIPRKNLRSLDGRPLVSHAFTTSLEADLVDAVALTTDSGEIANVGHKYDVDFVIDRPDRLGADDVPLAPVVAHALDAVDQEFDYVLCFQPTVPLVTPEVLNEGIRAGLDGKVESLIFVADSTHHYWKATDTGYEPISSERKNRQQMDAIFGEVGLFLSHRSLVREEKRIGSNPAFHEVPAEQGIDIDTYADWLVAESFLNRQQLIYRVTGNEENGSGHVYRGITIADRLFEHDIEFAILPSDGLALELLRESNYEYNIFESDEEFVCYVDDIAPGVVANDILDTDEEYVQQLRETGARVVNFEDLGAGAGTADAVVNAIYEHSSPPENHHYGFEYFCLRSEFRHATPITGIDSVDRIMVSFGGIDENNLTARTLEALSELEYELHVDMVLGLGYTQKDSLDSILENLPPHLTADIAQDVSSMADHMEQADLMVTSNGRTLYEACALNLPVISIAQNLREQKHPYAHVSNGVLSLGHADYVPADSLRTAIVDYIENDAKRETMWDALRQQDISNGIERVIDILFEEDQ